MMMLSKENTKHAYCCKKMQKFPLRDEWYAAWFKVCIVQCVGTAMCALYTYVFKYVHLLCASTCMYICMHVCMYSMYVCTADSETFDCKNFIFLATYRITKINYANYVWP